MKENKITFEYVYDANKDEAEMKVESYRTAAELVFATADCLAEIPFEKEYVEIMEDVRNKNKEN